VGAAALSGFAIYQLKNREVPPPVVALPTPEQQVTAEEDFQPRAIPEALPDFELPDGKGVKRKLSEWKGRPLIINFWATWCDPCRREIPLLKRLRQEHAAENLEVIGVAIDFREAVVKYAKDIGMDYPVLIGEENSLPALDALGMELLVLPFTIFSDRQSRIVAVKIGELHANEAESILARVREIDAGTLSLTDARQQIGARLQELAIERARKPGTEAETGAEAP
jgi:thiol-disulfide isomerase/thioredoxin